MIRVQKVRISIRAQRNDSLHKEAGYMTDAYSLSKNLLTRMTGPYMTPGLSRHPTSANRIIYIMENVPLNESRADKLVNVVFYEEIDAKGIKRKWLWVTDLNVTRQNVKDIVKAGRARWKIENETFNTLKNQGYHFEHNYGHGNKTLSNVLAGLMLLAFLIDQCLEAVNLDFQKILEKVETRSRLWRKIRSLFDLAFIESWEALYAAILAPPQFVLKSA